MKRLSGMFSVTSHNRYQRMSRLSKQVVAAASRVYLALELERVAVSQNVPIPPKLKRRITLAVHGISRLARDLIQINNRQVKP